MVLWESVGCVSHKRVGVSVAPLARYFSGLRRIGHARTGRIARRRTQYRTLDRGLRDILLLCTFANLGRTHGPQVVLLAHQPHRGPVALQTFSGTKLVAAAALAPRSLGGLGSAAMPADALGLPGRGAACR